MKLLNFNNKSFSNKFEDMFSSDKNYLIMTKDNIFIVEFLFKELIKDANEVKKIKKEFTEFTKDMAREAIQDSDNDLMRHLYSYKLYSVDGYNYLDLRKTSNNTIIRYLIDDNPENSMIYFANPEMVCNECFLEEAIGKFELLEFENRLSAEQFYKNQIQKL